MRLPLRAQKPCSGRNAGTGHIKFIPSLLVLTSVCLAGAGPSPPQGTSQSAAASPVLAAMDEELSRSMAVLGKADPPAYFMDYTVTETQRAEVMGSNGALLSSEERRTRWLEVQVRAGNYSLDNTRKVGDRQSFFSPSPGSSVPIEDAAAVLRRAIWLETDRQYRAAAEALIKIKTGKEVKVETAEGQAPDFSREKPQKFSGPRASFSLDRRPWEEKVRVYTGAFRASPAILNSIVTFSALAQNQYQASSEGTQLQFGQLRYRLELFIQGKAPDGMDINRYYNFDWLEPSAAPDDKTVLEQVQVMRRELEALVAAPLVEPYAGPALLTGRAAAVYFHEVFGHRAEGHRQKDITEGQTFARKVGEPVKLVEKGVLRSFLMSRSPLVGFPQSNGHGRRQVGFAPVSRQGNLIVESHRQVTNAELRRKLIEEVKRQNKPFGLLIDDIAGGFTFTGRGQPQAFQVLPLVVYKVYPDGRPDELV